MKFLRLFGFIATLTLCAPLFGQTAVSGSNVQDGTGSGALLSTGSWSFGSTSLSVSAGAFSGTVTPGTQTVLIENAAAVPIMTIPGVVIGSSAFSFNTFSVPATTTAMGTGKPLIACTVGAQYTQIDSLPAGALWKCIPTPNVPPGVGQWSFTYNPPPPPTFNAVASETIITPSNASPFFTNLTNETWFSLTQNVTSWGIANGNPGQTVVLNICENSTGNHTMSSAPSNVMDWPGLTFTAANQCNSFSMTYASPVSAWIVSSGGGSSGGGVGGGGTTSTIPLWSASTTLANSPITYNSTTDILSAAAAGLFTNTGDFVGSDGYNGYMVSIVGSCNPDTFYAAVQYNHLLKGAVGGCINQPSSGTASAAAVFAFGESASTTVDSEALIPWFITSANGATGYSENPLWQDISGLTSGVNGITSEFDNQPYNGPSAYNNLVGLHFRLFNPTNIGGNYPYTALLFSAGTQSSSIPATMKYIMNILQGTLSSASAVIDVGSIAAAVSGTSYGSPVFEQLYMSWWCTGNNGGCSTPQAENEYFYTQANTNSGNDPSFDYYGIYHNGTGPTGQAHYVLLQNGIDYAIRHSDVFSWDILRGSAATGASFVDYFPGANGTIPVFNSTATTANCIPVITVANGFVEQCSGATSATGNPMLSSGTTSNTDLTGELTFSSQTTATYTFQNTYTVHPECQITSQFSTASVGTPWASYSGTSPNFVLTINFTSAATGAVTYNCNGRL